MKSQKFFKIALLAGAFVMAVSCERNLGYIDDDPEVPGGSVTTIQPPTPDVFMQIRDGALQAITQTATFKAEDGIDFTSKGGVKFKINPLSMNLNGSPVTGNVVLEFIELYKRGDMLVVNKPLMGTSLNGGEKGPLITGGQFFISVTKDGEQVTAIYNLEVPSANTGDLNPDMSLWVGEENENGDMEWNEVGRKQDTGDIFVENATYNLWGSIFGWINIDILYSLPGPKTEIWVKVPDGYNQKNCSVYVVYKDKPGALAYMDVWDPNKKMFTEHYGLAPIGFNFYVVFVSVQNDGKFIYAVKDVIIQENKVITFEKEELKVLDKDALIKLINELK